MESVQVVIKSRVTTVIIVLLSLFVYSCLLAVAVSAVLSPILMNSSCQSKEDDNYSVGVEIMKCLESSVCRLRVTSPC